MMSGQLDGGRASIPCRLDVCGNQGSVGAVDTLHLRIVIGSRDSIASKLGSHGGSGMISGRGTPQSGCPWRELFFF